MRSVLRLLALPVICLLTASLYSQSAPAPEPQVAPGGGGEFAAVPLPPVQMFTLRADGMDAEPVKGAPFCATVVTEHTQMFADGNRIHTSDDSSLCRDGAGRIRREAGLNLPGAGSETAPPKLITIMDPVAGYRYLLDSERKIAHRFPVGPGDRSAASAAQKGKVVMYQSFGEGGPEISAHRDVFFKSGRVQSPDPEATEKLGNQDIDGIQATGTRVTTTIPAGKMGNDQPMTVTSEDWYSPELKATVMTKHSDPWAGERKTEFKDVNRAEPDPSLFTVPADYKIVDAKNGPFVIEKRKLGPPMPPPPQP